jgi:carboxymethylenebutenolidase
MKTDDVGLKDRNDFTRREFVVSMLAAGFAAAVQPVSAQTITTNTNDLTAGEIKIPTKDGQMPAYRAMPQKGTSFPIVLVVQEIFGVHEYIRDVCRRLAKLGYLAVAPELYARQGDVSKLTSVEEIRPVVAKVSDAQVMGDLDASVAWAAKNGGDTKRLGITGFCWGGRIVWLYAAHNANVKAGVAWYGRVVGTTDEMHPKNPIDLAKDIKPPVLGLYGGADQGIPTDTVEKMKAELKAAGNKSEFVIYPDVPHAFHADYRSSYRKEAAEDGWKRLQAWFKQHGVA